MTCLYSSIDAKSNHLFLSIVAILLLPFLASSQISITSTGGLPTATYTTLKASFDAINLGVHQGQITILVTGSTTETATAQLNASGGTSSYSSVTIMPTVACTISGSIAGPLINLNGADTVTIDGRIGGTGTTRSLTIQNTYNGTQAAAYAVQFANGANKNIICYTICEGLEQSAWNNATINSSGTNSKNKIDNNEIKPVGSGYQTSGISGGGDTITNNLIHDFHSFNFGGAGINTGIVISGNSLYHTVPVNISNTTFSQNYIYGGGYVTKNFIGGSAPGASGAATVFNGHFSISAINSSGQIDSNVVTNIKVNSPTTPGTFYGIISTNGSVEIGGNIIGSLTDTSAITMIVSSGFIMGIRVTGSTALSTVNIQNNKIGGLTMYGTVSPPVVNGIEIFNIDSVIIKNNIIGGNVPGSIKLMSPAGEVRGISITSGKANSRINISQNIVKNLAATFTGTGNFSLSGIFNGSQGNTSKRWIQNNDISELNATNSSGDVTLNGIYSGPSAGSTTPVLNSIIRANNIYNLNISSGGSSSAISGIRNEIQSSSYLTIDSNQIYFISSAAPNTTGVSVVSVQGIGLFYSSFGASINSNTIQGLYSTSTSGTSIVAINALHSNDTSPLAISGNRIYNLFNNSSANGTIGGIMLGGPGTGSFLVKNNMVQLSPNGNKVHGIFNSLGVTSVKSYYNSIYISGISSGTMSSSAFNRISYANTAIDLKDNIFVNLRTGGTGDHYAVMNANTNPSLGWISSNYNNFYTANPNTVALWSNVGYDLPGYRVASLQDSCSVSQVVDFGNPNAADLHLQNTPINQGLIGTAAVGVNDDFDGNARNLFPTMGADELTLAYQGVMITAANPGLCFPDSMILTSSVSSGNQWLLNGVPIPGATADTFTAFQSGNYVVYYANGCLSGNSNVITVTIKKPNDTVINNGFTLKALAIGTYQWLDCNNNFSPISGANAQIFTPPAIGDYAVQIGYNLGCFDTSDCIKFIGIISVNEVVKDQSFATIYPNPGSNNVAVRFSNSVGLVSITVINNLGQTLQKVGTSVSANPVVLDMSSYSNGVYFIEIRTSAGVQRSKWVKSSS